MLLATATFGQETVVKGKVTDAATGDPIPFANVVFSGTTIGTTTDFDGNFIIKTTEAVDSVFASYIGYSVRSKAIKRRTTQTLGFQLDESVTAMEELVFVAGENPAFEILRNVVKNKKANDKRRLSAYQYESYNKIEIDVDNITDKFRNKRFMKKITSVMDSIDHIAGEDGKPILPVFISESISNYYFRSDPKFKREHILKTKITGVGLEDGSMVSQLIGSSFQEYNFYQNWLNIVEKEFVSPIADGWKMYYEYDLVDSLYVGNHYCYRIDLFPKREQDLAFVGTIWIDKETYALKQTDLTVGKSANLNYVEKIKIQQELAPTDGGAWLPSKTRVLLDIGEITEKQAGVLAKFYTSNEDFVVNNPKEPKFYEKRIEVAEDATIRDEQFWVENRHDSLSETERNVYAMIDTLRNIPVVKTYTEILKVAFNGYKTVGPIDIGPYFAIYNNNVVEGHRFRAGFKTNIDFSNKWILNGYLAYGTKDENFKYGGGVDYIVSRRPWTQMGVRYQNDIDQVGLGADDLIGNSVFLAASRFGDLIRPYKREDVRLYFQSEVRRGLTQKIELKNWTFDPLYNFEYYTDPSQPNIPEKDVKNKFRNTELTVETRFAKGELFIQNDNQRISLGTDKWPIITLRYSAGIKGLFGGDFTYHKAAINVRQKLKMGFLGTSKYSVTGGKIFSQLPYPLLKNHIGNESNFYTNAAFSLMNYSEFVSDEYVAVKYEHFFQGFILNRIPLMKKLKWRLLASANVLYGTVREENRHGVVTPVETSVGEMQPGFQSLGRKPYLEVGYGVENILKIIRVDAFHRLSHLNNPEASKFGVKISFQFIL